MALGITLRTSDCAKVWVPSEGWGSAAVKPGEGTQWLQKLLGQGQTTGNAELHSKAKLGLSIQPGLTF
jgi:hypothetical protein